LPVSGFDLVIEDITKQGYSIIGEVDHPIARMKFFDTYKTTGVATEIMGNRDRNGKPEVCWKEVGRKFSPLNLLVVAACSYHLRKKPEKDYHYDLFRQRGFALLRYAYLFCVITKNKNLWHD
jgi:hypothetical protein